MGKVSIYICGDAGPYDEYNPFKVTKRERIPELLFLLNRQPMSLNELTKELSLDSNAVKGFLDDLLRINAVKEEDGKWDVNFAIFTREDVSLIAEKTKTPALRLAESIMKRSHQIEAIAKEFSSSRQVDISKLLFASIGCFVLDWAGLEVLSKKELILSREKLQPGNRRYVLLGREVGVERRLYEKMYWGSHSDNVNGYAFTSFGDHTGVRYAFPDFSWNVDGLMRWAGEHEKDLPRWFAEKISTETTHLRNKMMLDSAKLLFVINNKAPIDVKDLMREIEEDKKWFEGLLGLLKDMKYVSVKNNAVKLNCPVFTMKDKEVANNMHTLLINIIEDEACKYYNALKDELKEITPFKKGIDTKEIYTDIWHWVFGNANRIMAERGFFYDPPKEKEGEGRYIVWVSQT